MMMIKPVFLTKEDGIRHLLIKDNFLNKLNLINLNTYINYESNIFNNSLRIDDYEKLISLSVIKFPNSAKKNVEQLIKKINPIWNHYNLPPLEINFIATEGKESFGLPYTRGNNIILPLNELKPLSVFSPLSSLTAGLLIHEIFHILSRTFPDLKETLYSHLGFLKINEPVPDNFIINPDCPDYHWGINLLFKDEPFLAIPNIHKEIDKNDLNWRTVFDLKNQRFINAKNTNLLDLLGNNTKYTVHPEEICAEFFRLCFYLKNEEPRLFGYLDEIETKSLILDFEQILQKFKF